jgi:glycine cleavage system transcriptional repressor
VTLLAVTVIGRDQPGIIAAVTGVLADLGGNLEDSTMTILRGHFAMTLIVSVPPGREAVAAALEPVLAERGLLSSVQEVEPEADEEHLGAPYVLTVHGADRPGIVSAITRLVADAGGNITDLTTRLSGEMYLMIAEVEMPADGDVVSLAGRLAGVAGELGVEAFLRPADTDVL